MARWHTDTVKKESRIKNETPLRRKHCKHWNYQQVNLIVMAAYNSKAFNNSKTLLPILCRIVGREQAYVSSVLQ